MSGRPVAKYLQDTTGRRSGIRFFCPGCERHHFVFTEPDVHPELYWEFNEDLVKPTLEPSILVNPHPGNPPQPRCHSFVRQGVIQYLEDSDHALAGKAVPIPPLSNIDEE